MTAIDRAAKILFRECAGLGPEDASILARALADAGLLVSDEIQAVLDEVEAFTGPYFGVGLALADAAPLLRAVAAYSISRPS